MSKNKLVNIFGWISGILLIILGLLIALGIKVFGFGLCLCGVLLLPPASSRLRELTRNKFKGFFKFGIISVILVVSLIVGVVTMPRTESPNTDNKTTTSETKSSKGNEVVKVTDEFEDLKAQKQKDLEKFINLKSNVDDTCIQNQTENNLFVEFFKINQNLPLKKQSTANFANLGRLTDDEKLRIDQSSYDWIIYTEGFLENSKEEKCIKYSDFVDSKKYEDRLNTDKTVVKDYFLRGSFKDSKNTNVRLKFKSKVD